ncbi:hypothetical protein J4727_15455 [Providencia rettgeri]|uniref:DNA polymerase III subunit tau DnaB-binding domain-containing protein n=1 Tax=Providencia rettgeri TaxID=587 RepID=A0A939NB58_PRORE|nr:hypothetical protein [Providencia rettgeri]
MRILAQKAKPVMPERAKLAASALERLAAVTSKHQQNMVNKAAQAANHKNQSSTNGSLKMKRRWHQKRQ